MLLNEQTAVQLGDKKVLGVRQGDKFILGRHNLVPNGQGRYTSGTVEVRRNRALNPRQIEGGSTSESGSRYSWSRTYISTFSGLHGVTTASRLTSPSIETIGDARGFDIYANLATLPGTSGAAIACPVTPGETLHIECSFAMSFLCDVYMACRFHDGAGNWITNLIFSPSVTPSGVGVVTPISMDVVVPAGSAYLASRLATAVSTTFPPNSTMEMSELYIGSPGDYFDGSYSPDPDLTPSWTGTANASQSVLTGKIPINWLGGYTYFSQEESALIWFNGRTGTAFTAQKSWVGLSFDMKIEPGSAFYSTLKLERAIAPYDQTTLLDPSSFQKDGTWHRYILAGLIPTQASRVNILWPNFNILGKTVQIKNVMCSNADTEEEALRMVQAPYRDGDSPGWTWDGTPGQSASRGLS